MRVLIVSVGRRVLEQPLIEAAMSLRERGAIADLVSWRAVDKDLGSTFDNVVVLGPHGSSAKSIQARVTVAGSAKNFAGASAPPVAIMSGGAGARTVITTPPAMSAERVKRAIAWRYRKYRSRARKTSRRYASRVRRKLNMLRKHTSRARRRLNWHAQSAWRRFAAHPDAVRLSRGCDIVVAADSDAVLTVWHIARRRPDVKAVNGLGALASHLTPLPVSFPTSQSGNFTG